MKFICPHCEGHIEATEEQTGRKMDCPHCSGHIILSTDQSTVNPPSVNPQSKAGFFSGLGKFSIFKNLFGVSRVQTARDVDDTNCVQSEIGLDEVRTVAHVKHYGEIRNGISARMEWTTQLATRRQVEFLRRLGYDDSNLLALVGCNSENLEHGTAEQLIRWILRPIIETRIIE